MLTPSANDRNVCYESAQKRSACHFSRVLQQIVKINIHYELMVGIPGNSREQDGTKSDRARVSIHENRPGSPDRPTKPNHEKWRFC